MNSVVKDFNNERYSKVQPFSDSDEVKMDIILKLIGTGMKVLDVGCYDGNISSLIMQNGNDVYGVDISENAIELAKQRGIKAYVANAEHELPFSNNIFDTVFAGEIIEHIFDTQKFLQEIKRVLKANGTIILTTPNLATLGRRLLLLFGKNPIIETSCGKVVLGNRKEDAAGHIRYFVKDTLFELLESCGFRIDIFTSNIVNFNHTGKHYSVNLAKIFPTLGKTLIVKAIKKI